MIENSFLGTLVISFITAIVVGAIMIGGLSSRSRKHDEEDVNIKEELKRIREELNAVSVSIIQITEQINKQYHLLTQRIELETKIGKEQKKRYEERLDRIERSVSNQWKEINSLKTKVE